MPLDAPAPLARAKQIEEIETLICKIRGASRALIETRVAEQDDAVSYLAGELVDMSERLGDAFEQSRYAAER